MRSFGVRFGLVLALGIGSGSLVGCGSDSGAGSGDVSVAPTEQTPAGGGGTMAPGGPGMTPEPPSNGEPTEMGIAMARIGKGPESLNAQLKDAIAAAEPDWASILAMSTEYADLAKKTSELTPPIGDPSSWATFSGDFLAAANRLKSAAESQNATEANSAHQSLSGQCQACHRAHRVMGPAGGGGFRGAPAPGGPGGGSFVPPGQ